MARAAHADVRGDDGAGSSCGSSRERPQCRGAGPDEVGVASRAPGEKEQDGEDWSADLRTVADRPLRIGGRPFNASPRVISCIVRWAATSRTRHPSQSEAWPARSCLIPRTLRDAFLAGSLGRPSRGHDTSDSVHDRACADVGGPQCLRIRFWVVAGSRRRCHPRYKALGRPATRRTSSGPGSAGASTFSPTGWVSPGGVDSSWLASVLRPDERGFVLTGRDLPGTN